MLEEGMLSPHLDELVYHPRLQAEAQSLFVSQVSSFQTPQTSPLAPPFFSLLEQPASEPYVPLLQLLSQKCQAAGPWCGQKVLLWTCQMISLLQMCTLPSPQQLQPTVWALVHDLWGFLSAPIPTSTTKKSHRSCCTNKTWWIVKWQIGTLAGTPLVRQAIQMLSSR